MSKTADHREVPAIKVHQWLKVWDSVDFSAKHHRRKPEPHFYVFSLPAEELRSLCGIARRQAGGLTPRAADLGIQRQHDPDRSNEIGRFVEFGYPWSTLSEAKRKLAEFNNLRKPGWLPTAIVVNILQSTDRREGDAVSPNDIITVMDAKEGSRIKLPYSRNCISFAP